VPSETTTNMQKGDDALVEATLKGEHSAYHALVRRYKGIIVSYCYGRVRQRAVAEDLADDTFVQGFLALGNLRKSSAFCGWLLSIARNICVDYIRNKGRTVSIETFGIQGGHGEMLAEDKKAQGVLAKMAGDETHDKILEAIDSMPEDYRVTLILRHFNGYSCGEIADVLTVPVGTITSRLNRAHKILRDKLEKYVDPDK